MKSGDFIFGTIGTILIIAVVSYMATYVMAVAVFALLLPGLAVYGGVLGWKHVRWELSARSREEPNEELKKQWDRRARAAGILLEVGLLVLAGLFYLMAGILGGPVEADTALETIKNVGLRIDAAIVVPIIVAALLAGPVWVGYSIGSGLVYYLEELFGNEPQRLILPVFRFKASKLGHRFGFAGAGVFLAATICFIYWSGNDMGFLPLLAADLLVAALAANGFWARPATWDYIRRTWQ